MPSPISDQRSQPGAPTRGPSLVGGDEPLVECPPAGHPFGDRAAAATAIGGGTDYTLSSGTLTFLAGDVSEDISIAINDDAISEAKEEELSDLEVIRRFLWKHYFLKHCDDFACAECKALFDPKSECAISEFVRQADCDSKNQKVLEWWL